LPISFRISGSQGYLQFRQRVADAAEKLSWTSCCAESCPFAQVRQVSKECMIFSRWRSLSVMIQSPINTDWTLAFALLKSPSKVFRNPLVLLPYWRSIFRKRDGTERRFSKLPSFPTSRWLPQLAARLDLLSISWAPGFLV